MLKIKTPDQLKKQAREQVKQWELKKKLGQQVPSGGYIKFLADRITGRDTDEQFIDQVTKKVFFFCLGASAFLLLFRWLI